MIKDIVIAGGGFSGYITALMVNQSFKQFFPEATITVIDSSKIGTIGVGESTAQNVPGVLWDLGIDPSQYLMAAKGTFKLAARFKNWNFPGESYYHYLSNLTSLFEVNNGGEGLREVNI